MAVNVIDFGADPTGVADSQPAFKADESFLKCQTAIEAIVVSPPSAGPRP
jgi:hypothetical protein